MKGSAGRAESYNERFARAWQYGHNMLRLSSWQLPRFAHAYADITEDEQLSLGVFNAMWQTGEFEPDSLNRWHHKVWFEQRANKVA